MYKRHVNLRIRKISALISLAIFGLPAVPLGAAELPSGDEALVNTGNTLYQIHCAECHGSDAAGGSTDAHNMTLGTADLTRIAARNDGVFPFWKVYEMISGAELLPAHAGRAMPIWSTKLGEAPANIDEAALAYGRILAITAYLQSVQESGGGN